MITSGNRLDTFNRPQDEALELNIFKDNFKLLYDHSL